ncbi:hypothetical protein LBMAG35_02250 [Chlorobiota bacterium]|nr:hypothetical protein LBMAG35_02250 [Chlorobiota bacterium]
MIGLESLLTLGGFSGIPSFDPQDMKNRQRMIILRMVPHLADTYNRLVFTADMIVNIFQELSE